MSGGFCARAVVFNHLLKQVPTPKFETWESGLFVNDQLASGSGRIWNFTSLAVVPLPPSMWNGARVEIGV